MQFVPTATYTYWWPVNIDLPDPNRSGQWKRESFEMLWKATKFDEARELRKEVDAITDPDERSARQHDLILNAAADWRYVVNGKDEVPFSREMLTTMLNAGPWYLVGLYKSWGDSLNKEEARRGN